MKILILGLGNLLMGDDGVGVHVVRRLQANAAVPAGVAVVDGGTLGLDLLPWLDGVDRLLLVDALEMGEAAGTPRRLAGAEIPRRLAGKFSVHQAGVQDLLAAAELQGSLPPEVVIWGVQPECLEMGLALSPAVAAALPVIEDAVMAELARWRAASPAPERSSA